jgi:hypothetical protein
VGQRVRVVDARRRPAGRSSRDSSSSHEN